MAKMKIRVIDAYIYKKNNTGIDFLILKRAHTKIYEHLWQGVAGKIESGEEAWEAAIRELKEETGLKVNQIRHFKNYSNPDRDPRQRTISVAYMAFNNSSEIIPPNFLIRLILSKYVPKPSKKFINFNSDTFLTKF